MKIFSIFVLFILCQNDVRGPVEVLKIVLTLLLSQEPSQNFQMISRILTIVVLS